MDMSPIHQIWPKLSCKTVKGGRKQSRQRKRWEYNIREVHQVQEGHGEQRKMEETGCEVISGAPTTVMVKG